MSEVLFKRECPLCFETFPYEQMFNFVTCEHESCRICAMRCFEYKIKNFSISDIACPFAGCTILKDKSHQEIHEYFSILIPQLKSILSGEVVELLEKKIRDWSLSSDPNFFWCPKCESGMYVDNSDSNYGECRSCGCSVCPKCKKEWTPRHIDSTCEEFNRTVESNDFSKQTEAIEKLIGDFGIACPQCKSKYLKSLGGCLHFTCPKCKFQFCEGCLNQFYLPGECPNERCNDKKKSQSQGFHAHHPRNCFYYLRDWQPQRLQRLLDSKNVSYETDSTHPEKFCPLLEQKEDGDKLMDQPCGLAVEPKSAGLCSKHYAQYLCWLVVKNKVDPLPFFEPEQLQQLLVKYGIQIPEKSTDQRETLMKHVSCLKELESLNEINTISESFSTVLRLKNCRDKTKTSTCHKVDDVLQVVELPEKSSQEIIPNGWSCNFCTFINPEESKICSVCCRTNLNVLSEDEIYVEGWPCNECTFINKTDVDRCDVCGNKLNV